MIFFEHYEFKGYICRVKNEDFMKSFSELIKQRRSMRKFTDEELTQKEELKPILKFYYWYHFYWILPSE
jgi:hypothetical protein